MILSIAKEPRTISVRINQADVEFVFYLMIDKKVNIPDKFSHTCLVNWKSLLICLFVYIRLSFYENKGCYEPLMWQGLDKYSSRKRQLIKHK